MGPAYVGMYIGTYIKGVEIDQGNDAQRRVDRIAGELVELSVGVLGLSRRWGGHGLLMGSGMGDRSHVLGRREVSRRCVLYVTAARARMAYSGKYMARSRSPLALQNVNNANRQTRLAVGAFFQI